MDGIDFEAGLPLCSPRLHHCFEPKVLPITDKIGAGFARNPILLQDPHGFLAQLPTALFAF